MKTSSTSICTRDRQSCATRTGQTATARDLGDIVCQATELVFTHFKADKAREACVSHGALDTHVGEVAFDSTAEHCLLSFTRYDAYTCDKRSRFVGNRGRAVSISLKDVPRHTAAT